MIKFGNGSHIFRNENEMKIFSIDDHPVSAKSEDRLESCDDEDEDDHGEMDLVETENTRQFIALEESSMSDNEVSTALNHNNDNNNSCDDDDNNNNNHHHHHPHH